MKTKDYIKDFHLYKKGTRINSTKLKEQLQDEFYLLLEKNEGRININEFNACVDKIFNKIDNINLRAQTEVHEGFIKFFYATVILQAKRDYFPDIIAREEEIYQQRKKTFEHGTR